MKWESDHVKKSVSLFNKTVKVPEKPSRNPAAAGGAGEPGRDPEALFLQLQRPGRGRHPDHHDDRGEMPALSWLTKIMEEHLDSKNYWL